MPKKSKKDKLPTEVVPQNDPSNASSPNNPKNISVPAPKTKTNNKPKKSKQPKKKSLIVSAEEIIPEIEYTQIERMDFDSLVNIHDALFWSFHPDGLNDNDNLDDRFMSLWHLCLASVGWTNAEFWELMDDHSHTCPECGGEVEDDEELPEIMPATKSSADKPN